MKYQIGREDAKRMFPKVYPGRSAAVKAAKQKARKAAPNAQWYWKRRDSGLRFRGPKPLTQAAAALEALMAKRAKNADLDAFALSNKRGITFILKEVIPGNELADPWPGSVGFWHQDIVSIYRINFGSEFKDKVRFGGAYNCRRNNLNQSIWSMHSNWPPVLAIDTFCSQEVDQQMRMAHARNGVNGIVYVYHFGHQHAQVGGNRSGTPVCA